MTRFSLIRPIAATVAAMVLSACALLSTPDPVQTYRFGGTAPAPAAGHGLSATATRIAIVESRHLVTIELALIWWLAPFPSPSPR